MRGERAGRRGLNGGKESDGDQCSFGEISTARKGRGSEGKESERTIESERERARKRGRESQERKKKGKAREERKAKLDFFFSFLLWVETLPPSTALAQQVITSP